MEIIEIQAINYYNAVVIYIPIDEILDDKLFISSL